MPSPGVLRHLKPGQPRPHTIEQCDRELERLTDLTRSQRPAVRAQALARINCWLDERLRAMRT